MCASRRIRKENRQNKGSSVYLADREIWFSSFDFFKDCPKLMIFLDCNFLAIGQTILAYVDIGDVETKIILANDVKW